MSDRISRRALLSSASLAILAPGISMGQSPPMQGATTTYYDLESLVGLIMETPRSQCVEVLGEQVRRGLSYRQFLAGMLHAAVRYGGAHEIAMMYSAFRISIELPVQQGPLPLFWALDSLTRRIDNHRPFNNSWFRIEPKGTPPKPDQALQVLNDAIQAQDQDTAELAALSLSQAIGIRQSVELFWKYTCRDSDDLGHKAIACANVWRTMNIIGWEHGEIPLRYLVQRSARGTDNTFSSCVERVLDTLRMLPADWCSDVSDRKATLDLHEEIRSARTEAAVDLVCEQLVSGKVKAGSVWDAIHLSAAELLLRNKKRSRGWSLHAVTSSNALHFSFRTVLDYESRLLLLLQATARLSDQMTRLALEHGDLRDLRIRDLEPVNIPLAPHDTIQEIFALLPQKGADWGETTERDKDEQACRMAFSLLADTTNRIPFVQATCGHLIQKATWNAHDMKFPAAAFEDASVISEQWRPHFLAATVHAIHGPASDDTQVFKQAREVLETL